MIARIARLRPSALSVLSGAILLVALAWAVAPGLLTSQDPISGGSTPALLPPSAQHWFGTDEVGRDLYTRVVYGARQTLAGALVAVALGFVGFSPGCAGASWIPS